MGISLLQQPAAIETDTPIKDKLIGAKTRLLTIEKEQLEMSKARVGRIEIWRLFAHIYSRR
jgi:hypothetical protein